MPNTSSQLIFTPSNKQIQFFRDTGGSQQLQGSLVVENPLDSYVQIKIKTNTPKWYAVSPHTAIFAPNDVKAIKIVVHSAYEAAFAEAALPHVNNVTFLVQEVLVLPDEAAAVQAQITAATSSPKQQTEILSAFWKDLIVRTEAAGQPKVVARFSAVIRRVGGEQGSIAEGNEGVEDFTAGAGGGAFSATHGGDDHYLGATSRINESAASFDDSRFVVPASDAAQSDREAAREQPRSGSYPPVGPPSAPSTARFSPRLDTAPSSSLYDGGGMGGTGAIAALSPASLETLERALPAMRREMNETALGAMHLQGTNQKMAEALIKAQREIEMLRSTMEEQVRAVAALQRGPDGGAVKGAASDVRRRAAASSTISGGSGSGVGASAVAEEDDDSTTKDADIGFALWQLLLVAIIAFLVGRLSTGR